MQDNGIHTDTGFTSINTQALRYDACIKHHHTRLLMLRSIVSIAIRIMSDSTRDEEKDRNKQRTKIKGVLCCKTPKIQEPITNCKILNGTGNILAHRDIRSK